MNWCVFKRDDPDTWPELDCLFIICGEYENIFICKWDPDLKCFYDSSGLINWDCLYASVGYLPYIEKELHPMKCAQERPRCAHYDDEYCLCEAKCKSQIEVTEYTLGYKRIWKEF